jgi:CDP-paratose 2-epimerase
VGCNLAHRLLSEGRRVRVLDRLCRAGVERNLQWLQQHHGDRLEFRDDDIRDGRAVREAVRGVGQVFHFAAQVAVTTSLIDPITDFEINARGTLNLLEAIRAEHDAPPLVFTSTNKVYGGLEDVTLRLNGARYEPEDECLRSTGIGERRPLDFHSPYGCSKGAADQYVIDYARTFGIPAVVLRMSCIYGPRQFGNEDQGWVAHFLIRALEGETITLYGDGKQVRDILFVDDLVDAFLRATDQIHALSGRAFNIGGGPRNTVSLLELLDLMAEELGRKPEVGFADWRPGDQRYYVSDTRAFQQATGWRPMVGVREGVGRLAAWLRESRVALPSASVQPNGHAELNGHDQAGASAGAVGASP